MKISLVYIGTTGAGPVYSLEMAKALSADSRCELQVIVSENVTNLSAWEKAFQDTEVSFHVVKTYKRSKLSVFLNSFNLVRKYRIYSLVRQFHPDVLYSPFVLMWERFLFALCHGKMHIVKTIHDVKLHDSYHNLSEFVTVCMNWGSMRFVDSIVLLNHKDKPAVQQRYHRPVVVIPHACLDYYFTDMPASPSKSRTIGFIGRIEPYKGLDLLVEAFGMLRNRDVKLLIAGNGKISPDLMTQIQGDDRIELINRYILDEEFQGILSKMDFVVLPYKRASQSGVIPMCFAGGKTVVATDVGALAEQVPEGTGLLVSPSAEEIANAIDYLYEHPEQIAQYGLAARDYAMKQLSWQHSADLLLTHMKQMTGIA